MTLLLVSKLILNRLKMILIPKSSLFSNLPSPTHLRPLSSTTTSPREINPLILLQEILKQCGYETQLINFCLISEWKLNAQICKVYPRDLLIRKRSSSWSMATLTHLRDFKLIKVIDLVTWMMSLRPSLWGFLLTCVREDSMRLRQFGRGSFRSIP